MDGPDLLTTPAALARGAGAARARGGGGPGFGIATGSRRPVMQGETAESAYFDAVAFG